MNFDAPSAIGKSKTASRSFRQLSCAAFPPPEVDDDALSNCWGVAPTLEKVESCSDE
jgi:hypothetical protein